MNKWMTLAGAGVLALAVFGVAVTGRLSTAADKDKEEPIIVPKEIAEAVSKLADDAGKGNDTKKSVDLFYKKNEDNLKKTMWIFKPRMKNGMGGFGVGPKPGVYEPDGIEALILTQGNPRTKPMKAGELKEKYDD